MLINLKFWIIPYLESLMDSLAHFLLSDSNFITAFIFLSFITCIFIYKTKQNKKIEKATHLATSVLCLKWYHLFPKPAGCDPYFVVLTKGCSGLFIIGLANILLLLLCTLAELGFFQVSGNRNTIGLP